MINTIIGEGYAYEVNGSVYFDVKKYSENYPYGKLSGRIVDDLLETTRTLEGQEEKRNKGDFALWKSAPPHHIMRWNSPWGQGFPGWHIECSAMSTKYLGTEFDIHGGGMDLQFPHHESEIAQSSICNKHAPARYWIHNNMITVNGRKMGKSYNNQIRLTEMFSGEHPLLAKGYSPMTIRFFILQTHYRSTLDFGNEALQAAEKGLKRLWEAYDLLKKFSLPETGVAKDNELETKVLGLLGELEGFMNDDFNTAKVLANLFELVPVINSIHDKHLSPDVLSTATVALMKSSFELYLEEILGLRGDHHGENGKLSGVMSLLIDLRKEARSKKDYATSDKIRNQLQQLGILLKDEKDGNVSFSIE
jgi:cysteinyl-tRNA synthetase